MLDININLWASAQNAGGKYVWLTGTCYPRCAGSVVVVPLLGGEGGVYGVVKKAPRW